MAGPVVLTVLDGYGIGTGGEADATAAAHLPFLRAAADRYPNAKIETSGEAVGLPPGQMGNSEVGHMTMGAGRVIEQDLTRISREFERTPVEEHAPIRALFDTTRASGGTLHLIGLVSDGGVHSHIDHLQALLTGASNAGIPTALHVILDGRDVPPRSGAGIVQDLCGRIEAIEGPCHIATVSGRYYAMDRDSRWLRISRAYHAMVCRLGESAPDASSAIEAAYARNESDEFVAPTAIEGGRAIEDGDTVFFFNFRADRARELTNALTGVVPSAFKGQLKRERTVELAGYLCMTEYDASFGLPVAFAPETHANVLGEVVARAGLAQLRMAETEKYAHVTFFFNSGQEAPFPDEERVLIPSPRDVDTYDHRPEMSAAELTSRLLERIESGDYAFILINYANPDMVGHTGVMDATVKAVETIDGCLERVAEAVLACGGQMLITADHGNCELMVDPETGEPHTAHTTNPVPIYWIHNEPGGRGLGDGTLADLAPTVLELMQLPIPTEMSGRSLIVPPR